jgi:predicted transcriptional regulator
MSDPKPGTGQTGDDEPVVHTELTTEERAAVEEGWADALAGRVYTQEQIFAWLKTWGTDDEKAGPDA